MLQKRLCLPVMILFFLVGSLTPIVASDLVRYKITDSDLRLREGIRWYGLYQADKKLGYFKETFFSNGTGSDLVWVHRLTAVIKLQSSEQKTEMELTEERVFDGQPPYGFRRGRLSESVAQSVRCIEIEREGEGLKAVISEGGERFTRVLPYSDYTLGDEFAKEVWIRNKPKHGETVYTRFLDIGALEMDTLATELVSDMRSMVDGVEIDIYEVRITSQRSGTLPIHRLDSQGKLLSFTAGPIFEARFEPEHLAKKIEYGQNLFVFGISKLDKPLGLPPQKVKSLVLRVSGEGASKIPNGPRQAIHRPADSILLYLGRNHGHPTEAADKEIRENLKETVRYPIKHQKLMSLAREAVGDASDDWVKVMRLVTFVSKFIKDEHLLVSLPVFEIIKQGRGDCSEHALLFTALARTSGIPAREVLGLTYLNDGLQAFGWHAWCEVAVNGQWVPVDPTWLEFDIDATHISMGSGESWSWLETIGQLSFKLVSVNGKEPAGKP
jgi:hypothetical protein